MIKSKRNFRKIYLFICWSLLILVFITEMIVINIGYDWFSKQFYWLRCIKQLSLQGLIFYIVFKVYQRTSNTSNSLIAKLKAYRVTQYIIVLLTIMFSVFEVFRSTWMEPGHYGSFISIYFAGVFLCLVPLSLERLTLKQDEKTKKQDLILLVISSVLGVYFFFACVFNWLIVFNII